MSVGPGARPIAPGSCYQLGQMIQDEPGQMPREARPAPRALEPGRMPPWGPVGDQTGTNELARPQRKPCFLLMVEEGTMGLHVAVVGVGDLLLLDSNVDCSGRSGKA